MTKKRGHGEGFINQRKDGRWQARLISRNEDGVPTTKCFYGRTRKGVQAKLDTARENVRKGVPLLSERLTVGEYLVGKTKPADEAYPQGWLAMMKSSVRPHSYLAYEAYVRIHVLPSLGRKSLARLSPADVSALQARKLQEGLSATTVSHLHAVLHRAMDQAVRWGLAHRNVVALVDPPRRPRHEFTVLSPEQARALLRAGATDKYEGVYVLAVTAGLRQGEILALRWGDLNLSEGYVNVNGTLQRAHGRPVLAEPKTASSRRQVLLTKMAMEALLRHKARQSVEKRAAGPNWHEADLVFTNAVGRPVAATNLLRRSFAPLLERAGCHRIRFHDLRHTSATLALMKKVPAKVVSEMLGHSQISVTLNLYSHVVPGMQRDATLAMEELLGEEAAS